MPLLKSFIFILFFYQIGTSASANVVENNPVTHLNIVTEHLPPFQIRTPNKVLGFATEIIENALSNTPYTYEINAYPWSRSYNMALNKVNTCIYSIARTEERNNQFIWVNTIAERNASFIGLRQQDIIINSIEDAKQYRTAVIRDDVTHQYLINKGFKDGENLYVLNDTFSLLKLLKERESIHFILVDSNTIKYRARFNNIDPELFKVFYQVNKEPLDYYLACNKNTSEEVITNIRKAIANMKANGQIERITKEWQYPAITIN